jgi:hypothetical protein
MRAPSSAWATLKMGHIVSQKRTRASSHQSQPLNVVCVSDNEDHFLADLEMYIETRDFDDNAFN